MTSKAFGLAQLGNVYNDGALSNRNLVINGAMQVAQRGTTGTSTGGGYQSVDRFSYVRSGYTPSMTRSQENEGPSGFSNSHKVLTATAATVPVSGYASIYQAIESANLQHLNYGSSDAVPITLSFWVKSNLTGTFSVMGLHYDTSALYNSNTYTIAVADTWEYKTITFVGQTTYPIDNDTGAGMRIEWCLSAGTDYTGGSSGVWSAANSDRFAGHAVDITGTLNNYLQITGVQLEVGDTATPFEHRSYGQELALCQRYYWLAKSRVQAYQYHPSYRAVQYGFPVVMRTAPSVTQISSTATFVGIAGMDVDGWCGYTTASSGDGTFYYIDEIAFDAEL